MTFSRRWSVRCRMSAMLLSPYTPRPRVELHRVSSGLPVNRRSVVAIEYQVATPTEVDVDELLAFYERQNHDTTESADKLRGMLERSACFVTARDDGRLIGIARGIADGVRGYLTECKLDPQYQGP